MIESMRFPAAGGCNRLADLRRGGCLLMAAVVVAYSRAASRLRHASCRLFASAFSRRAWLSRAASWNLET